MTETARANLPVAGRIRKKAPRPRQAKEGAVVGEVCRKAGISEATFYNWRKKYNGLTNAARNLQFVTCPVYFWKC
jgi:transposase-like protein